MNVAMLLVVVILFYCIHFISAATYTCDPTSSCGCSALATVVTSRIVGGEAASDHTWGWMISLQYSGSHICGASLLTSEYAVTAAHCVEDSLTNPSSLSILAGTNYLNDVSSPSIQRRTVTNIISHPNYDSHNWVYDIAIVQFSPLTVSSDSKLAFICLPNANEDPFQVNTNLVAIGWGYTNENIYLVSNSLQQVTVQVVSSTSAECLRGGLNNSNVQFCAGVIEGGKDTCQGDSGGPLMAFVNNCWLLAGITSSGTGCAEPGYAAIYTRVSAFISFIDSNTNISMSEMTTLSLATLMNQTTVGGNQGNIIDKSMFILIFSFVLPVFLLLFY